MSLDCILHLNSNPKAFSVCGNNIHVGWFRLELDKNQQWEIWCVDADVDEPYVGTYRTLEAALDYCYQEVTK